MATATPIPPSGTASSAAAGAASADEGWATFGATLKAKAAERLAASKRPAVTADEPGAKRVAVNPVAMEMLATAAGAKRSNDTAESPSHVRDVKRACVAAVSLDEPVDYSALDTLEEGDIAVPEGISLADTRAGKKAALEMLVHYGVFEARPIEELEGVKRLRARWEPQRSIDGVKWRYVAQEFKWMEERDDCFAAASTATTAKVIDFLGLKFDDGVTFVADCVKAYYQADQIEEVCVAPPAEYLALRAAQGLRTDVLWYLHKMLPGQRTGGAAWIATARSRIEALGYDRNLACPQFYYHREKKVLLELHMDDIHGVGASQHAAKEQLEALRATFDLKGSDVIVQGRYAHLKRERLKTANETLVRGNPSHIDNVVTLLGMEKAKTVPTPSLPSSMVIDETPLEGEAVTTYRRAVGILLYLSPDRWDIQRDVQLMSRKLKEPREHDYKRLVRVVRYLKGTRSVGVRMRRPKGCEKWVIVLDMFSDTDYAGCVETRRAMTCGQYFTDGQPIYGFARRQGVQSTSSGEGELDGASSVAFDGRLIKELFEWLGFTVVYNLHTDSSSAKAMINRDGVGGVKHLDVRAL